MKRVVKSVESGVVISFSDGAVKDNIVKMVQNCAEGKCECMSEETKRKIDKMEVRGDDGSVELELTGSIDKEEIEEALKRSKVINS